MALLENEKSYEIKITVADLEGKEILYGNGCFTAPSVDSKVTAQCCVCMIPVQNYGTGNVYLKIFHPQNSTVELSEPAFDVENIDERESYPDQPRNGGGIFHFGKNLILKNCELKNNMCKNLGSAICCSNSTGDVELDNCVIKNNSAQIGNVTVLVTRSITLNGNVEFDVDDLILFKEKINITANSELSKIKKVKISVENNMYTENEQVLYGNTEDNCQKFLIPDTTWNINSDGILEELRVLTSSPGDNCPESGYFWIKTPGDINKIRKWVEESKDGLSQVDFKLFNVIVFDDSEFIPIGTADKPFRGKLDTLQIPATTEL